MVGEPGTAFVRISRFFDVNRAVIGLKCVGAALQTVDETVAHARKRVVFGAPMAAHQAVTFPLAEAATHLELARWQCYRVLWMRQRGRLRDVIGWQIGDGSEEVMKLIIVRGLFAEG